MINKHKLADGWTKEKVMERIRKYNNGNRATRTDAFNQINCTYQAADGNRCAIGCFIPDGHPALREPNGVHSILAEYPDLVPLMPFKELEALAALQCVHDVHDVHDVPRAMSVHEGIEVFLNECVE